MKLGSRGLHLIESFEGFRSKPYRDAVGVWTIGYGSTGGVGPGTRPIGRDDAEARLKREVDSTYGAAVNRIPGLNQNQFDAITSFVYNVGPGGIGTDTGIGRALRSKNWKQAADELLRWDKAGGRSLPGLTRRRQAERKLFLSPVADPLAGFTAAEKRWIKEFDELRRTGRNSDRRQVLRRVMTKQRKEIYSAAEKEKNGWNKKNRRRRYNALRDRT